MENAACGIVASRSPFLTPPVVFPTLYSAPAFVIILTNADACAIVANQSDHHLFWPNERVQNEIER